MKKDTTSINQILDSKILRRLYTYVKPYQGTFYFIIFLILFSAILAPLRPLIVGKAIDEHVAFNDYVGLLRMIIILIVIQLVQAIVFYLNTYYSSWLGQNIIRDIRIKLYKHIISLRLKYFDNTPIGRLVTRNVSDVETLAEVFSQGMAALAGDILQLSFILGFMFYINWQLTLVSLSTLPLLILATYVFKEKVKRSFNMVRNAVSNLNAFVQEHITGMNIVQIFNAEEREYDKFKDINKEHLKANIKSVMYYSVYFPVAEVIQAMGIGLLVWFGSRGVMHQSVAFGDLIMFIMYIQMFFRPIRQIADRFNTLQMGIVSSNRIFEILDNDEHIPNNGTYVTEKLNGKVEFRNVWFAYNDENWVLRNIDFEVEPGKSLALVGATGAGKSSIINLINRFYDINKGQILLDGVDVNDFELSCLRRQIGVVLQDVFLFSDTIENNITLGNPNITKSQIYEAAELVGARQFIDRLPGGLKYNVMERGSTLSVGQRQMISFIRAMVYDPHIMILDEATSSVDTETEELIQQAITKMMKGRTSIVIAHRLSTIQNADNIMVLDHGEIKEQGTHGELLSKNGYYTQLYQMQYKEVV